jgi:hypothetical protein
MNCTKCKSPSRDMGEAVIHTPGGVMFGKDHLVDMFVCSKCNHVDFYYKRKTDI